MCFWWEDSIWLIVTSLSLLKVAGGVCAQPTWRQRKNGMGPVRIHHSSHHFATQSSHFVDRAGWQVKMASIEIWMPRRNAYGPHCTQTIKRPGHIFLAVFFTHMPSFLKKNQTWSKQKGKKWCSSSPELACQRRRVQELPKLRTNLVNALRVWTL